MALEGLVSSLTDGAGVFFALGLFAAVRLMGDQLFPVSVGASATGSYWLTQLPSSPNTRNRSNDRMKAARPSASMIAASAGPIPDPATVMRHVRAEPPRVHCDDC